MKATGIVRRIDDLGRVVIPKEIRRTLRIKEGDPLEIYTDAEGGVIFKKYSPIGELSPFATIYAEVLSKSTNSPIVICDRDHVVAVAGVSKKEYLERRVTSSLEELIEARKSYVLRQKENLAFQPVEGVNKPASLVFPIIVSGDVTGAVLMLTNDNGDIPGEIEIKLTQTAATLFSKQLE